MTTNRTLRLPAALAGAAAALAGAAPAAAEVIDYKGRADRDARVKFRLVVRDEVTVRSFRVGKLELDCRGGEEDRLRPPGIDRMDVDDEGRFSERVRERDGDRRITGRVEGKVPDDTAKGTLKFRTVKRREPSERNDLGTEDPEADEPRRCRTGRLDWRARERSGDERDP